MDPAVLIDAQTGGDPRASDTSGNFFSLSRKFVCEINFPAARLSQAINIRGSGWL